MNKLTLTFNTWWLGKELESYILSLKGVYECKINDKEKSVIYIKYDNNKIGIKVLKYEILTFLDSFDFPLIISFDKFAPISSNYTIKINDLCCEHCLMGMIEDLLIIDGIEKASTNFDYHNKENVLIFINYDSHKITIEEIKKLEEKFNK